MRRRLFSSVSVYVLLVIVTLFLFQKFDVTGVFLMIVGAQFAQGVLVHIFLVSILIESIVRRVPRAFIIVPIFAYGGYYAAYFYEAHQIALVTKELRSSNPGKLFDFDPKLHSLVMDERGHINVEDEADGFVQTHAIPLTFSQGGPEGYLSYRLITKSQFQGVAQDTQFRVNMWPVRDSAKRWLTNIYRLRLPERPLNETITVTKGGALLQEHHTEIRLQTTKISMNGTVIGSFRMAFGRHLTPFPLLLIGCVLNDAEGRWHCLAQFDRTRVVIDGIPDSIDRAKFDTPVSVMLGIPKYTPADLQAFSGFEINAPSLQYAGRQAAAVDDKVFGILGAIVDGKSPELPIALGYSLAARPERLVPLSDRMLRRFSDLLDSSSITRDQQMQLDALAIAIGALPQETFANVAGPLFSVLSKRQAALHRYPLLYVRLGEAGPITLPFYRQQFMDEVDKGWRSVFPVLALCRIGEADADLIEEMKKRYLAVDTDRGGDRNYKVALFVTLLKLGQKAFLEANHSNEFSQKEWDEQMLAGKGATKIGPNNCMPNKFTYSQVSPVL
jgi:hypothetical protein